MIGHVNKIVPGVSHALASSLDFMPTIMSIVGDPIPSDGVGYDLSDYLLNGGEVYIWLYFSPTNAIKIVYNSNICNF